MKKRLTLLLIVTLLVIGSFTPTITSAYTKKGWRVSNPSFITYKWGASLKNGVIKTGWVNSASSWRTSTSQNIRFYHDANSVNFLTRYTVSNSSLYGKMTTTYNTSTKRVTKYQGYMNDYSVKTSNYAKSVGGHELGHALGLGHSTSTALMNTSRNRNTVTTPRADDLNGVKNIYGISF